jgi:hypothetical protein
MPAIKERRFSLARRSFSEGGNRRPTKRRSGERRSLFFCRRLGLRWIARTQLKASLVGDLAFARRGANLAVARFTFRLGHLKSPPSHGE